MLHGHIGPRASGFRVALIEPLYLRGNIALFPCQSCDAVAHWHIALWRPICWADSHFYSSRFAVPRLCSTTAQLTSQGLIFLQDMCHRSSCFQLCQKKQNIITRYIYILVHILYIMFGILICCIQKQNHLPLTVSSLASRCSPLTLPEPPLPWFRLGLGLRVRFV
jgi:hypothetical protein